MKSVGVVVLLVCIIAWGCSVVVAARGGNGESTNNGAGHLLDLNAPPQDRPNLLRPFKTRDTHDLRRRVQSISDNDINMVELLHIPASATVVSLAVTADNSKVVAGLSGTGHEIKVWSLTTGLLEQTFGGNEQPAVSIALTPDNTKIVTGHNDNTIKIWSLTKRTLERTLEDHSSLISTVALTPDGKTIVSGGGGGRGDGPILLWSVTTGVLLQRVSTGTANCRIAIAPDSSKLVVGQANGDIMVYSMSPSLSVALEHVVEGAHSTVIDTIVVTPDSRKIVSVSRDGTVKVWSLTTFSLQQTLTHCGVVVAALDNNTMVSAGADRTIKVWSLTSGDDVKHANISTSHSISSMIAALAVTSNDNRIVTGSHDGTIQVWQATTTSAPRPWSSSTGIPGRIAVAPERPKEEEEFGRVLSQVVYSVAGCHCDAAAADTCYDQVIHLAPALTLDDTIDVCFKVTSSPDASVNIVNVTTIRMTRGDLGAVAPEFQYQDFDSESYRGSSALCRLQLLPAFLVNATWTATAMVRLRVARRRLFPPVVAMVPGAANASTTTPVGPKLRKHRRLEDVARDAAAEMDALVEFTINAVILLPPTEMDDPVEDHDNNNVSPRNRDATGAGKESLLMVLIACIVLVTICLIFLSVLIVLRRGGLVVVHEGGCGCATQPTSLPTTQARTTQARTVGTTIPAATTMVGEGRATPSRMLSSLSTLQEESEDETD